MSDILGQYEKELPIIENPNSDFYIRALDDQEESIRIPFNKVGVAPFCDLEFVCFVGNTQYTTAFGILQGTTVRFEDRINTNKPIFIYEWRITDTQGDFAVTLYEKSPSYRFNVAGSYSVTLTVKDVLGNIIATLTKVNHILVSETQITLFQVTFTVLDNPTSQPLEGVTVIFNGRSVLTGPTGIVISTNIPQGSILPAVFIKEGYYTKSVSLTVNSNLSIEVRMIPEAGIIIPEYPPIYMGYLIEETQGQTLTEAIIRGITYPTQQRILDDENNAPTFPLQVNVEWKNKFGTMNPFVLHTLFVAIPQGINDEAFLYYQNMDAPIVKGLISTQATIEVFNLPSEDSNSGSGGGSDIQYNVFKFTGFGPVNYRLSVTNI